MVQCGTMLGHVPFPAEKSIWDVPENHYDAISDRYTTAASCEFRQLFQDVPAVASFYSEVERSFHTIPFVNFAERYWKYAWVICAVYVAFCFSVKAFMKDRKPLGLRYPLIAWNAALSLFSFVGFLRTAPHLMYYMYANGFYASACTPAEPSFGHGAVGLWTMLFVFSKIPELGDTAFVVLRKKPLIFLHWYHHVTVLLYCWHSYKSRSSAGLYFVVMNYGVHALMYFYYTLTAMRIHPSWAPIVTALQISQMFVGMAVCAAVYYFQRQGLECDISTENYRAGLLMYASYAALFLAFAFERYIWRLPKQAPAAVAAPKGANAAVPAKLSVPAATSAAESMAVSGGTKAGPSSGSESEGVRTTTSGVRRRKA